LHEAVRLDRVRVEDLVFGILEAGRPEGNLHVRERAKLPRHRREPDVLELRERLMRDGVRNAEIPRDRQDAREVPAHPPRLVENVGERQRSGEILAVEKKSVQHGMERLECLAFQRVVRVARGHRERRPAEGDRFQGKRLRAEHLSEERPRRDVRHAVSRRFGHVLERAPAFRGIGRAQREDVMQFRELMREKAVIRAAEAARGKLALEERKIRWVVEDKKRLCDRPFSRNETGQKGGGDSAKPHALGCVGIVQFRKENFEGAAGHIANGLAATHPQLFSRLARPPLVRPPLPAHALRALRHDRPSGASRCRAFANAF